MGINFALTVQLHEASNGLFSDSGNCEQYFMESGMVLSRQLNKVSRTLLMTGRYNQM